jgi:hypothetical protein
MSESAQLLGDSLKQIPEPLQGIIRNRITSDSFKATLKEFQTRFSLTEEQYNSVSAEILMVLCQVTDLEDMKDSLIAEADLSYEVALRVQRAFQSDILDPIMTEAEAQGYSPASEAPAPAQATAPNRNQILYDEGRFRVTYSTFSIGGTTYPINKIVSISRPFQGPGLIFRSWIVAVTIADQEQEFLQIKQKEAAEGLYAAIQEAMEHSAA